MEPQKSKSQEPTGWPDDWYVYDGETVKGPLSAKETFSMPELKSSGQKCVVSRKGFSQWYDLRDLSAIFNLTSAMGHRVEEERGRLEKSILVSQAPQRVTLKSTQSKESKGPRPQVAASAASLGAAAAAKQPLLRGHLGVGLSSSLAKPVDHGGNPQPENWGSAHPVPLSPADVDFAQPGGPHPSLQDERGERGDAKQAIVSTDKDTKSGKWWMRDYIYAKTQLRLGEIRQPWVTGLCSIPLTLGVYWVLWFRDFSWEIRAHSSKTSSERNLDYWWSALPLAHIFMTYRLASQMRELERENRYEKTVPWIAALLAIFPPFAVIYLQAAANKHWLLHVRHAKAASAGQGKS